MLVGTPATYAVQARGQEGDKVGDGFDVFGADWSEERLGERQASSCRFITIYHSFFRGGSPHFITISQLVFGLKVANNG